MQDCFRKYPEVYGAELADEEDDSEMPVPSPDSTQHAPAEAPQNRPAEPLAQKPEAKVERTGDVPVAEDIMKPRKAFDTTDANKKQD